MKLSDKLIAIRKENGWSQEDFADKLDVSRQAISRWENGTALPDAQNILRISKLFNVSADYLLNDDYEGVIDPSSVETTTDETNRLERKKKHPYRYLIPATCFIILAACSIMGVIKSTNQPTNEVHIHPAVRFVTENEVAPTCTTAGSVDVVLYCEECGGEVFRTSISKGMPTHQFYNEKCIVCGEDQRERTLQR